MVVPFVNLPMHVFQAEHAAQAQIAQNAATTGQAAVASERTLQQATAKESQQVTEMDESDGLKVDTESGSAQSHTLTENTEEEQAAPREEPAARTAPDPTGRGTVLDVSA